MARKAGIALLFALALASVHLAQAQQQAKLPTIGWLAIRPVSSGGQKIIRRMLREIGYVEGKNIAFEDRFADDKLDRLPALADELVRLQVDVLLTPSTPAAIAAKNATRTISIVFLNVADPIATGLVDSLAPPGGNITGFTTIEPTLAGKRLELLKETVPNLSRVGCFGTHRIQAPRKNGKKAKTPGFDGAFQAASKAGVGAVITVT